jgi:ATP-dependent DNA helicase RecG
VDPGVFQLVKELAARPTELEWLEFKVDWFEETGVGEYISALANAAVLAKRPRAYLVWGVRNSDHEIVGTTVNPFTAKVGNEDFLNWLHHLFTPHIHFEFRLGETPEGLRLLVLEINAANGRPLAFQGIEYIRLGSYKKKLKEHHEHERQLWKAFEAHTFETQLAVDGLTPQQVVQLLDYPAYFELMVRPLPEGRSGIIDALLEDNLLVSADNGSLGISNLGAVLFARDLTTFPSLERKAPRVIRYKGLTRVQTQQEQLMTHGYAAGFEALVGYLHGLIPDNEIIGQALRQSAPLYPSLAIRELVANALIHQDFSITGTGPMIELFDDRLEITNPGIPLVEASRFIDHPPQSRNEALAGMLRRSRICEERGSGWDKIVYEIEYHQLPAPLVQVTENHTRAILFAPRPLTRMDKEDRVRALYLHACLKYVNQQQMTNTTVRQRFGIAASNSALASRLIREAINARAIVPYDPDVGYKAMRYVPAWTQHVR